MANTSRFVLWTYARTKAYLESADLAQLEEWLRWNDPNGDYDRPEFFELLEGESLEIYLTVLRGMALEQLMAGATPGEL